MIKSRTEKKEVTKHIIENDTYVIVHKPNSGYFKLINSKTKNYLNCGFDCEEDLNELIEALEGLRDKL